MYIHANYDGMLLNITALLVHTGHNEGILSPKMLVCQKIFNFFCLFFIGVKIGLTHYGRNTN